ncbi:MAG: hypothetical protein ACKOZY_01330 [Flavobacteriales bacterium]
MKLILTSCLLVLSCTMHSQTTPVHYELTAEHHMFMCPFLTPIFMSELEQVGATDVVRTSEYALLFNLNPADYPAFNEELIRATANRVGFIADNITVKRTEE